MSGRILVLALAGIVLFLFSSVGLAHGGGRDSNGGHVNRSTGEYHCQREDCVLPETEPIEEDVEDPPDGDDQGSVTVAGSWGTAKEWARDIVYEGVTETFRLEWEHVVPASLMPARSFACWNEGLPACAEGGRACCESKDLNAQVQIFDLHNLVRSVGQANALRSNKRYGSIVGEERLLGSCDFEWSSDLVEPEEDDRGMVARIWLCFAARHNLHLQPGELAMYLEWSNDHPPLLSEFVRNDRIRTQQGNGNPFVEMFPRP